MNRATASALVLMLAACAAASAAAEEKARRIVDLAVADALARPGDAVVLRAKLERSSIRGTDIEDASIEFRLDGRPLGFSRTDDDGIAVFRIEAPAVGDHVVKALYEGDDKHLRAEYNAILSVREANAPLLVLDIDGTISMTDNLDTAIGSGDSPPFRDAAEVVRQLDRRYDIVYVTARARQLRNRTHAWLDRYDFPRAPTFFLDLKKFPTYNEARYKISVLQPLRDLFPNMRIAIGDKASDLEAYRATGLSAILHTQEDLSGARTVRSWSEVPAAVQAAEAELAAPADAED